MSDKFKKSVLSVAVKAAMAGALVVTLAGCGSDGDRANSTSQTDATQPVVNQINNLKGTVTGFVFDTNGKAIEGARVTLAGRTLSTSVDGAYTFADVPVTNVRGTDGDVTSPDLVVSISVAGYANATVRVSPSAQVEGSSGGTDGNGNDGGQDNIQHSFVDGFLAQAGTAILPKFESTVTGRLVLPTGQPLPGASVVLDFNGVLGQTGATGATPGDTNTQAENSVSLGVPTFKATTDANGNFTFTSVAADSNLKLFVEGWALGTALADTRCESTVNTEFDDSVHTLGDVVCKPYTRNDAVPPIVHSVSPVANPNVNGVAPANAAVLAAGVNGTGGVTIRFSESLKQQLEQSRVFAYSETTKAYKTIANVAQSADGFSVTVTFAEPIAAGEVVQILMPKSQLHDLAGNALELNESVLAPAKLYDPRLPGSLGAPVDLSFTAGSTNDYAQVRIQGYQETSTSAAMTAKQNWSTDPTVTALTAFEDTMALFNPADAPVPTLINTYQQFNTRKANTGLTTVLADERLNKRLAKEAVAPALPNTVRGDVARISVALTTGKGFKVEVRQANSQVRNVSFVTAEGAVLATDTNTYTYDRPLSNQPPLTDIYLASSEPALIPLLPTSALPAVIGATPANQLTAGDVVTFIPLDDFGNEQVGQNVTVTLADKVPATTALQESYGLSQTLPLVVTSTTSFGDGGENSIPGTAATVGSPLLYVTPRILAGSDALWTTGGEAGVFGNLTQGITGSPQLYSAANWTAFAAASQNAKVGVAFTEAVTPTATAPAWAGTAALSGWGALSTKNTDWDDSILSSSADTIADGFEFDGLTFNVAKVLDLAADGRTSTNQMSFTGAVTDAAGNVSTAESRAAVAIADAIPPFVTSATFSEDALTITFNEAIQPHSAPGATDYASILAMVLTSPDGLSTGPLSGLGYAALDASLSADGRTVTLNNNRTGGGVNLTNVWSRFSNGQIVAGVPQPDDAYDFNEGSTLRGHAVLDFGGVKDVTAGHNWGVSWAEFTAGNVGGGVNLEPRLAMTNTPKFLAANLLGAFTITPVVTGQNAGATNGTADTDGLVTVTLNFTHPLNRATINAACNLTAAFPAGTAAASSTLAGAGCLTVGGAAVQTGATGTTLSLSNGDRTLAISLREAPANVGGATITYGTTVLASVGTWLQSTITSQSVGMSVVITHN
ncbi:hypothetical protein HDN1F_37440 [gamma proteobacterium HdN1]|nr:hypothetical protein HDN1F_37440 [gamma proteobacterium HdN1]